MQAVAAGAADDQVPDPGCRGEPPTENASPADAGLQGRGQRSRRRQGAALPSSANPLLMAP
ncbi:hypothetical protein XAC3810_1080002 [Xanthomonas citri pv. citri]|uniref:Uncharacterized protein n=1 Tax=Xanthomonas citri pv. citri TaxID=611301 RepID=A0A0U5BQ93_XANCI|nr:hypothetical protein XAC3810_1080002 [Xanthomonas citri pv. citri]CEE55059.1 hypothetical protein XACW160_1380002 [Xanthomonas citri pv. citri]CEE57585.1 hypothetical protein XAC2852_1340014 [Xanthomonas citri pv. citri]CEG15299.1 hypothetical protein XAC3562_1860001 [Xanthomonas citri pv. citri]CEH49407.1 hypothetical protein XAC3610_11890003 [Xanthomonas citri pv. citri]